MDIMTRIAVYQARSSLRAEEFRDYIADLTRNGHLTEHEYSRLA